MATPFQYLALSMLLVCVSANSSASFPSSVGELEPKIADKNFVFNLKGSTPRAAFRGGSIRIMSRANTPGLKINYGSPGGPGLQALIELGPCGFRTPHTHPRGTENFYIIHGSVEAVHVRESGQEVVNRISAGYSGFFPVGSIHYVFNNSCKRAKLLVVFDTSDPGTVDIADTLRVPGDIAALALGVQRLERNEKVAKKTFQQSRVCLARCRGAYWF